MKRCDRRIQRCVLTHDADALLSSVAQTLGVLLAHSKRRCRFIAPVRSVLRRSRHSLRDEARKHDDNAYFGATASLDHSRAPHRCGECEFRHAPAQRLAWPRHCRRCEVTRLRESGCQFSPRRQTKTHNDAAARGRRATHRRSTTDMSNASHGGSRASGAPPPQHRAAGSAASAAHSARTGASSLSRFASARSAGDGRSTCRCGAPST